MHRPYHNTPMIPTSRRRQRQSFFILMLVVTAAVSNFLLIRHQEFGDFTQHSTTRLPPNVMTNEDSMYLSTPHPMDTKLQFWSDNKRSYVKKNYTHTFPKNQSFSELGVRRRSDSKVLSVQHDHTSVYTIRVVYYINTKLNENYPGWIQNQLTILAMEKMDELYIVADAISCANETRLRESVTWLRTRISNGTTSAAAQRTKINLECHDHGGEPAVMKETFEYHGIHKLWELGQNYSSDHDIAIYFHSKGLTRAKTWQQYLSKKGIRGRESKLTTQVFSQVDRVLEAFSLFPAIDVAGWDCSMGGFVWYNFMYVRGSYLNIVEQPLLTSRRHYYEEWLRRAGLEPQMDAPYGDERSKDMYPKRPLGHCYGLAADGDLNSANIGYYFDHARRVRLLTKPE